MLKYELLEKNCSVYQCTPLTIEIIAKETGCSIEETTEAINKFIKDGFVVEYEGNENCPSHFAFDKKFAFYNKAND